MTEESVIQLIAAFADAPVNVKEEILNTLAAVPYGLRTADESLQVCADKLSAYIPPIFINL
jgi:hypothetical protein